MKKKDRLIEEAMTLSKEILGQAALCARDYKKSYKKVFSWKERILFRKRISDNDKKAMFFQFVFLFFYIFDKFTVEILEPDDKTAFMSILWLELFESPLIKNQPEGMSEYREALLDAYNDFIERYRRCKKIYHESSEEDLENTLLFEFSKDIAELTHCPNDFRAVMLCYSLAAESLMQLKIRDILRRIK